MGDKQKWAAVEAATVAVALKGALAPFCERIEIAGSLRRGKRMVSDIELLYVGRRQNIANDFFNESTCDAAAACLDSLLNRSVIAKRPNSLGRFTWGPQNKLGIHVESGIPVDFFSTSEANWWVSLVIRTGSKETNLKLTTGAQARGRTLHAYGAGVEINATGEVMACRSEEDVFEWCGVPYLKPEDR